jgi:hypothetical protein
MPAPPIQHPIATQLISGVWKAVADAVTSGLTMKVPYAEPRPVLDTVVIVSTEEVTDTKNWGVVQLPYAPAGARVEKSDDVFDIIHHFPLSYHDLRSPDTNAIEGWAEKARLFELDLALNYYAQHAAPRLRTAGAPLGPDPGGWGQLRCVTFGSASWAVFSPVLDKAGLDRPIRIDGDRVNGLEAVVFRIAGGPYVRRPAVLSLGWTPAADCGAHLLLTEQLEFVNVDQSTVIGLRPP